MFERLLASFLVESLALLGPGIGGDRESNQSQNRFWLFDVFVCAV